MNEDDLKEFERQWVDGEHWISQSMREHEGAATDYYGFLNNDKENMPTGITLRMWDHHSRASVVSAFCLVGLTKDPTAVRRKLWEMLGRLRGREFRDING